MIGRLLFDLRQILSQEAMPKVTEMSDREARGPIKRHRKNDLINGRPTKAGERGGIGHRFAGTIPLLRP
jgi:hypothetical protein